jgi:hypothetical protein
MKDWLRATAIAALVSGIPSTVHALLKHQDPLAATKAAGKLALPRETRTPHLLAAAIPTHLAISLTWGYAISRIPNPSAARGAAAGLAIAALDLHLPGKRLAPVRQLQRGPQLADHVVFGATIGWLLKSNRHKHRR